ncbi:MAG: cysteine synthase A [Candidatus Cloacimonetes bacterium]|nr:cysteine synthase A [Candidatus Cloacimonadota bacterium]MCK9333239.1 cysteine synthase A [Candidatus Cloacimonadota bacterium]
MSKIYSGISELVGSTPLVEFSNITKTHDSKARILAKLEMFNPSGSIKDRIALSMIVAAEKQGAIQKGGTLIAPTSGNTGIGLAAIGASKGYKVILTIPKKMFVEIKQMIVAYGADIVLTDGTKGIKGAIDKANQLVKKIPNSIILSQFINQANSETHRNTTGPEIWEDTDGKIDILIAGVGTGGTITGAGEYLRSKNPDLKIIVVEPKNSPILSEGRAGSHMIQGIGAGFVPEILDTKIFNEVITVKDTDAFVIGKEVARAEGVLVGISSGAALWAALEVASRKENEGKTIVVILPDNGDRYLSTPLFN